jgi:ATP-dependent DNA helicase RecG
MPTTKAPERLLDLTGVGPKVEAALNRLGVFEIKDLLFHLPARYEDRTQVVTLAEMPVGKACLLQGEITASQVIPGRRMQAVLTFEDPTGAARIRLFHFSRAYLSTLQGADQVRIFGEARSHQGAAEFVHPEITVFKGTPPTLDDRLTPIYPTTEGLTQPRLRSIIQQALDLGPGFFELAELLDPSTLNQRPSLWDALCAVHQPAKGLPPEADVERLALEELLAHRLLLLSRRAECARFQAPAVSIDACATRTQLITQLPFALTEAQRRVLSEIDADLTEPHPMLRLLQGDVGSGKTLVAGLAALPLIEAGYQVALMAPTELLSEQHANQFSDWFRALGISVGWLSGSMKTGPRRAVLQHIASGTCQMVIGTHALFQAEVSFHQLGLVIIDEQHRFGVAQRLLLREKGGGLTPHQLIMTATPIPRTLAMTHYADLDVSVIDALPPGRTPVDTRLVSQGRDQDIIERLDTQFSEGGQAYWVCTLIEDNDQLQAQAAESRMQKLETLLPHRRVGLVHGRLHADDKRAVMQAFSEGALDLLVATTVIEVGVNVPNANIMVIENPERLGLAQLHQLRGRVGRGSRVSYCILLYGDQLSEQAKSRLQLLRETNDGFKLAAADLERRGPGDVTGTRQTGELLFKLADLNQHAHLLDEIAPMADAVMAQADDVKDALIARWIGHQEHYAHV